MHHGLYSVVKKLIDTTIPLWNKTLVDLKAPGYENQRWHTAELGRQPPIVREPGPFRPPEQRATQNWLDESSRFRNWIFVDLKREFWNIGVQVVMQLTNINLTPDNPRYEGEQWHVQGQMVRISFYSYLLSAPS